MLRRWLGRAAPSAPVSDPAAGRAPAPDLARRRRFLAEHVLIHTHVPKTAGATLAAGLASIVGGVNTVDLRLQRSVALDRLTDDDLRRLSLLTGHFAYGLHARFAGRRPLYFAAVRDPAERAVSSYRYLASHSDDPGHDEAAAHDFETWQSLHRERRPDEQSRMLLDARPGSPIEPDEAIAQADAGYFLVIPQPEMTRAVAALRAAFGVSGVRVANANVSVGHEVVLDMPTRQAIRAANAADTALYQHVRETFEDRLELACDYIAGNCLERLPEVLDEAADPAE